MTATSFVPLPIIRPIIFGMSPVGSREALTVPVRKFIGFALAAGFVGAQAQGQGPVSHVSAVQLYQEYAADWQAADARYDGKSIVVTGRISMVQAMDQGVAHMRTLTLVDGGNGQTSSIAVCFTERCDSLRRPTIDDARFQQFKKGDAVRARCSMDPVTVFRGSPPALFMINLARCEVL